MRPATPSHSQVILITWPIRASPSLKFWDAVWTPDSQPAGADKTRSDWQEVSGTSPPTPYPKKASESKAVSGISRTASAEGPCRTQVCPWNLQNHSSPLPTIGFLPSWRLVAAARGASTVTSGAWPPPLLDQVNHEHTRAHAECQDSSGPLACAPPTTYQNKM